MDTLELSMMSKTASDSKSNERNLDTHATCMVIAVRKRSLEFYFD